MSSNASAVVPTCQFQGDGMNYSDMQPSMGYNNVPSAHFYQDFSNKVNIWSPQSTVFDMNLTQMAHQPPLMPQQGYHSMDHTFYRQHDTQQHYPGYNSYDVHNPMVRQDSGPYMHKMEGSDEQMALWQQCDAGQSSCSQPQVDPCAQVVQVLQCYHQGGEEPEFVRKAIESLVKKLKDKRTELDALISAVTNGGKEQTSCVTIQRSLDGRLQVAGKKGVPHVVYARIWRWPNVNKNELQKMDMCGIPNDHPDLICINPFHYERVVSSNYGNLDMNINPRLATSNVDFQNGITKQSGSMGPISMHSNMIQQPSQGGYIPELDAADGARIDTNQQQMICSPPVQDNGLNPNYYTPPVDYYQQQPVQCQIPETVPLPSTMFFMYGVNQQPNHIKKYYKDGTTALTNNTLPSFSNDGSCNPEWKTTNNAYPNTGSSRQVVVIDRYNAIRQMLTSRKLQEKDSGLSYWCSINYYELDTQIGESFNVPYDRDEITIDGGTDPGGSRKGRFCLGALSNVHRTEASERARAGIGLGIKLTNCSDGSVYLQCNALKDVFVRSYYLDFEGNMIYGSAVHKFENGTGKKVFDLHWAFVEMSEQTNAAQRAYAEQAQAVAGNRPTGSMMDRSTVSIDDLRRVCCTIAISFVKGWGAGYNRTSLKDTPCWVELQLNRPLKLLNKLLQP